MVLKPHLKIVEISAATNRYFRGRVRFVKFEICVDDDVTDGRLASKLNVDQVRKLAVRLPVSVDCVVSELLYAEAYMDYEKYPEASD